MKSIIYYLITGLTLFFTENALATEQSLTKLNILFTNGNETSFIVSDDLTLLLNNNSLTVTSLNGNNLYELSDIQHFSYDRSSGSDQITTNNSNIILLNQSIKISTPGIESFCYIHSSDGILLQSYQFIDSITIPTSNLPKGVLIISINNNAPIKIILQ